MGIENVSPSAIPGGNGAGPRGADRESPAQSRFDQAVLATSKVSADDLRRVRKFAAEKGERVDRMLVDLGFLSEDDLVPLLARFHGVEVIAADKIPDSPPTLERLSVDYMRSARILPICVDDGTVTLAMADPGDACTIDNVELVTGLRVLPVLVRARDLTERFDGIYGSTEAGTEAGGDGGDTGRA